MRACRYWPTSFRCASAAFPQADWSRACGRRPFHWSSINSPTAAKPSGIEERTMPGTLTFMLMDAPFENARSTTALRLIDNAVKRGFNVNVFAYEGAVYLPFAKQAQHANAVHARSVEEENHPLPRAWIAALMKAAA